VAQSLLDRGFKSVKALKGGWNAWLASGGQVEPKGQEHKKVEAVSDKTQP
jgi:3-mercaptopyruvate sulfurtransferase SseA